MLIRADGNASDTTLGGKVEKWCDMQVHHISTSGKSVNWGSSLVTSLIHHDPFLY